MKKVILSMLSLMLALLTVGCSLAPNAISNTKEYFPQDGVWFCEELQIQLAFDGSYDSCIVENGKTYRCTGGAEQNSKRLGVSKAVDMEEVLDADYLYSDENSFTVQDIESKKEYRFVRITDEKKIDLPDPYWWREPLHVFEEYFSDDSSYINAVGTVRAIEFSEDESTVYLKIDVQDTIFEDDWFKLFGDNAEIVKRNGIEENLAVGDTVSFYAPAKYWGEGYVYPIIALTANNDIFLSKETGKLNLLDWFKKNDWASDDMEAFLKD